MTPLRELQLLEAYRAGGPAGHEAMCELIRAYQHRVYSICIRMVRHEDDAIDLTHDVLLKLIESLQSYQGRSKLSTWVIRMTINACISHLRKQKVRVHVSLESTPQTGPGGGVDTADWTATPQSRVASREPLPTENVEHRQTRAMVLEALNSLEPDTRAILVLRDLQDLDYQQLAEALDVPLGTVKSRLYRARIELRNAIEQRESPKH
jgi:RNA polymerase sigma-70 factor (ECF subfamily)